MFCIAALTPIMTTTLDFIVTQGHVLVVDFQAQPVTPVAQHGPGMTVLQ